MINIENTDIIERFGRLDIEKEVNVNRFCIGILDRFGECLSNEQSIIEFPNVPKFVKESNDLLEFIKLEKQYLLFFNKIFEFNKNIVYIYAPGFIKLKGKDYDWIYDYLNDEEKKQLQFLLKQRIYKKNNVIILTNLKHMELFVKMSFREICFSNFFFCNTSTVIIGNYEMNFPVYSLNSDFFEALILIAKECQLNIRK